MPKDQVDLIIEKVKLFHGLGPDDVRKIFGRGLTMNVRKGDVVFYKDTEGDQMYVVLGGMIGVYHNKEVIAKLRTGEMFGEMALVTSDKRSVTVIAMEDSHLFILKEDTFEKLMTKRVAVRMLLNMVKTLSQRLKESNVRKVSS